MEDGGSALGHLGCGSRRLGPGVGIGGRGVCNGFGACGYGGVRARRWPCPWGSGSDPGLVVLGLRIRP